MKKSYLLLIALFTGLLFSCQSKQNTSKEQALPAGYNKLLVSKVIEGGTYSYLKGNNGTADIWVAIQKQAITVGNTYYYKGALEMKDFHSKELDRDFPVIYFLNEISDKIATSNPAIPASHMKKSTAKKLEVTIEAEEGVTNLSALFAKKAELSGKKITVKGKVAKFNKNIMGKNWIHIQDGSEFEGNFDLAITSADMVSIGQIVKFKGVITLNKDFGAGYSYDVIMENAILEK
ncbi:hypothetical protein [Ancylomarina longa]|uniref:DNA-binding protein n=1 Tax=Ancylomarina longa TaxID=2487017 RepID=A0A434AZ85_9BACT|nr:hypothetical protein [Ancylomarina longa]RUT79931.1 hypothetical protein DLK05_00835 [Ancylomarina longa]